MVCKSGDAPKPFQTHTIQAFQSTNLRLIASAFWYVTNKTLHKGLKIATVGPTHQNIL